MELIDIIGTFSILIVVMLATYFTGSYKNPYSKDWHI